MGLFNKKTCSICGNDIKLLGNTKLKDGNLCKDCRKKLSIWFDEFASSTIEDIKNQLELREKNAEIVSQFKNEYVFGEFGCILINETTETFVALPYTSDKLFGNNIRVNDISDIIDRNPDILYFTQVKNVEIKNKVNQNELKKTENGKQVSYNPKRYQYMCNVEIEIEIQDHPYISKIYIPLNSVPIEIKTDEPRRVTTYADQIREHLTGLKKQDFDIENNPDFRQVNKLEDLIFNKLKRVPDYSFGFKVDERKNWRDIQKLQFYIIQGEQIKRILEKE